jgi:hypothetical protein
MDVTTQAVTGLPIARRPWHALPGAEALTAALECDRGLTAPGAPALQFGPIRLRAVPASSSSLRQLRVPGLCVACGRRARRTRPCSRRRLHWLRPAGQFLAGGWREWNAESDRGYRSFANPATVLRDGVFREIDAAELVPGDVAALECQLVPADRR